MKPTAHKAHDHQGGKQGQGKASKVLQRDASVTAALNQVAAYHREGRLDEAHAVCQRILSTSPQQPDALCFLGLEAYHSGQFAAAVDYLGRAVAADGHQPDALDNLGLAHIACGDPEQAVLCHGRAIAIDAARVDSHVMLGNAQMLIGDMENAARSFEAALKLKPDYAEVHGNLGTALREIDRTAEAIEHYQRAAALLPDEAEIHNNLGIALRESDRFEDALTPLRRAVELDPTHVQAHHNLGKVYAALGQPATASPHFRTAIDLSPDLWDCHTDLGQALIDQGQVSDAVEVFNSAVERKRRPWPEQVEKLATFSRTTRVKLAHDIEQLSYLLDKGRLGPDYKDVLADYKALKRRLFDGDTKVTDAPTEEVELPDDVSERITGTYNRFYHMALEPEIADGALNPATDWAAVEADYRRNSPGYSFLDGLLKPEALEGLRRFCLESAMWSDFRFDNGYLGAFLEDGFCCPLLLQVANDLRLALPGIFGDNQITKIWAFKYDSTLTGIDFHADFAAVNVNFWITPDSANLDPDTGGLVVWDKEAPLDWDFATYNSDSTAITDFIAREQAEPVNVPHRCNRALVFNSDLFHRTGDINFREGYENRRINITLLYGFRES